MKIRLVHLYPRELGINGDLGNVTALVKRAAWRGIEVEVVDYNPGDSFPGAADLIHVGSGPRSGQLAVARDLDRISAQLRDFKAQDVPFLAIAGGWQLLGQSVTTEAGDVTPGAAVFSSAVTLESGRHVGEVVLDSSFGRLAGFENHGSSTTIFGDAQPLGTVVASGRKKNLTAAAGAVATVRPAEPGSTGNDETPQLVIVEGIVDGASIGTTLAGPFLPLNPRVADALLVSALVHAGSDEVAAREQLGAMDNTFLQSADEAAAGARLAIERRLGLSG